MLYSYDAWRTYIPEPAPLPYFRRTHGDWVFEYDEWVITITHKRHPLYIVFECSEGPEDKLGEVVYRGKTIACPIPERWRRWIWDEWEDLILSLQEREEGELRRCGR